MRTEMRIDGADCPTCLDATIDALRAVPGVRQVVTSITAGCLAIDHDDLDVAMLVDTVRSHLHGVSMASAEIVMISVEPLVTEIHCSHGETGHG